MDSRPKPGGISITDIQNAIAGVRQPQGAKRTRAYWTIYRQIKWEQRQKVVEGQKRARAEGKRIGRPPNTTLGARIAELREGGWLWREICHHYKLTLGTAYRRFDRYMREKNLERMSSGRLK